MQPRLHLITLGTHDLEATAGFYEQLFGTKRSDKSQGDVVFLRLQGLVLSLFPLTELAADAGVKNDCGNFRGFSLAHNAASPAEVDSLFSAALAYGAKAVKKPEKAFWEAIQVMSLTHRETCSKSPIIFSSRSLKAANSIYNT